MLHRWTRNFDKWRVSALACTTIDHRLRSVQYVLKAQVRLVVLFRTLYHHKISDTCCRTLFQHTRHISTKDTMSLVVQNFHEACEEALNRQINLELYASYVYLSMAYYFDRSDVALEGLHKYFKKSSDEEREHAMKFMTYQNKRGGNIDLTNIANPPKNDWVSARDAMVTALELEKQVNESLLNLHALASKYNDPNLLDFLETEYLQEQVDTIKEIADHITNLERVGTGLGEYIFDKELKD
ncbi:soma ferritin-like [Colletes latitarsis]|uniref:soma ferritin-like n=1 Tax=Colletes latitarsis TaxID=2605962 RepID=UPI0040365B94